MPMRWLHTSALLTCLLASPAFAADNSSATRSTPRAATTVYDAAFFAKYAPQTALDVVQRIPGFTLDLGSTVDPTTGAAADVRGFAGVAGNVVINGSRPSSKSENLQTLLARLPASQVLRIEVGPGDLFGADYASKSQVANLILSAKKGVAGNASFGGERYWFGRFIPNATGSIVVTRGPSTFTVAGDTGRAADFFESGYDRVVDASTGKLIEYRKKLNGIHPRTEFISANWADEPGKDRSIHLNARFSPTQYLLDQTNQVEPANAGAHDDTLTQHDVTNILELGGDVTRPLASGAVKLVGLINRQHQMNRDVYISGNLGGTQILGGTRQQSDAHRDESIGRLSWSRPNLAGFSVDAGGEIAWNTLGEKLGLFALGQGGSETPTPLPIQNAKVTELRDEVYVSAGRALAKNLRVNAGLNYEISHLKVAGDASAHRSLSFAKPSVTIDWQPGGGWNTEASLRRTVAQLNFYDFVSAANLGLGQVSGGNANLQPQRTWEGRFVVDHPLLGKGKVRLELGYDLVSMLQDRILVHDNNGNAFDAPGNIGTGRRAYADLTFDAPLDNLWSGLRLKLHGMMQRTRVTDPISGKERDFSFSPRWQWDADIRRDAGKFAYGFSLYDARAMRIFRTDEVDRSYLLGFWSPTAFIDYRPTARSTISFRLTNVTDRAAGEDRQIFIPNRSTPSLVLNEHRYRNAHVQVGFTIKQSFGASQAAG